jgi:hypothetical protein
VRRVDLIIAALARRDLTDKGKESVDEIIHLFPE